MPTRVIIGCLMLLVFMFFLNMVMLAYMLVELKDIRHAIMHLHWDVLGYLKKHFPTTKIDD